MSEHHADQEETPLPSIEATQWARATAGALPQADIPQVTLVYHGLLGLCYDDTVNSGCCRIGFHNLARNHNPRIDVVEVVAGKATVLFGMRWQNGEPPAGEFRFRLDQPHEDYRKIHFYVTDGRDEKDFRRIIDLEGREAHFAQLNKPPGAFTPQVTVSSGVFHTLLLTHDKYILRNSAGGQRLNRRVAFLSGARLCAGSEESSLVLDHTPSGNNGVQKLGHWPLKGRNLYVIIRNDCPDSTTDVPDFTDFYKAVPSIPAQSQYTLSCAIPNPQAPDPNSLDGNLKNALVAVGLLKDYQKGISKLVFSTNRAPCGIAGFGQSTSLT